MRFSCALALMLALSLAVSSRGFRLKHKAKGMANADVHLALDAEETDGKVMEEDVNEEDQLRDEESSCTWDGDMCYHDFDCCSGKCWPGFPGLCGRRITDAVQEEQDGEETDDKDMEEAADEEHQLRDEEGSCTRDGEMCGLDFECCSGKCWPGFPGLCGRRITDAAKEEQDGEETDDEDMEEAADEEHQLRDEESSCRSDGDMCGWHFDCCSGQCAVGLFPAFCYRS